MKTDETKNKSNRVSFAYEVANPPTAADIKKIKSAILEETEETISVKADGNSIIFGGDSEFISHVVLDVGEAAARNMLGAANPDKKSDLILMGSGSYSVQPCFMLTSVFDDDTIAEIERLYEFVTGIKGVGYFTEKRFYIDTNTSIIKHGDMDIAEILVRRMIDGTGNRVESQGFKALPRIDVESGESLNEDQMFEQFAKQSKYS